VHVQQYFSLYHGVSWIGPLFLANGAACVVAIAGLSYAPTRQLAALAGIVISAVALAGLVVSYGQGLFGWQEVGFRTAIALAVTAETAAVILLSTALVATTALLHHR
jgi:energy-coupling factor transporter transmembrane protein EcfT